MICSAIAHKQDVEHRNGSDFPRKKIKIEIQGEMTFETGFKSYQGVIPGVVLVLGRCLGGRPSSCTETCCPWCGDF